MSYSWISPSVPCTRSRSSARQRCCWTIKIPSSITTLGTLSLCRGLALSDGRNVAGLPRKHAFVTIAGGEFAGLPVAVWVLLANGWGLTIVFCATRFGNLVRSIGSNPDATSFSGISLLSRTRIQVLVLSGALAGLGAVVLGTVASGLIWNLFATGVVILLAVALDSLLRRRREAYPKGTR